ncbi:YceD family protein [Gammaproteobacteria bacterium]|nr:YceD family protein [Gammaproteobacteria bacterium]
MFIIFGMDAELPDEIDCTKSTSRAKEWTGRLGLEKFNKHPDFYRMETDPVLKVIIVNGKGVLNIEMSLYVVVELECQRCLRPFSVNVNKVGKYIGIEAGADYKSYSQNDGNKEIVTLLEGKLSLTSLVEEEIFLEIPMIPKHFGDKDCQLIESAEMTVKPKTERKPFADLARMIKDTTIN